MDDRLPRLVTPHPGMGERVLAGALALYALAIVAWLLGNGVPVTRDDGFYYLRIAQHVAAGEGSTFDGLHVTNGYHPLWLLCLVPLFRAFPGREEGLRAAIVLQGLLLAASAALFYRTARTALRGGAAALACVLWLALVHREGLGGLEFSLQSLLLLATAWAWQRLPEGAGAGTSAALRLGGLLALAFLGRLDNLALAALMAWSLARRRGEGRWASVAALAAPVALALAGYAAVNIWLCGHPLPVSAAVKRDWARELLRQDPYYAWGGWLPAKLRELAWPLRALPQRYPLALTLGTVGFGAMLLAARSGLAAREDGLFRALRPWSPFALFAMLQVVAYALLYHGQLGFAGAPWHFAIQPILAAVLTAALVERAAAGFARGPAARAAAWVAPTLAALAVVWTALSLGRWRDRDLVRFTYEAARWIDVNLPPDARIASWHAGSIGYLSGRQVVNLDGLVNSWEFFRAGRHDLCAYWQRTGVGYLADMFAGTRAAVPASAQAAYRACEDRLQRLWVDERTPGPWKVSVLRLRVGTPAANRGQEGATPPGVNGGID